LLTAVVCGYTQFVVDPQLGRVMVGNAPPFGQAMMRAQGQGAHRFLQAPDGSLRDFSWLRVIGLNAQAMRLAFGVNANMLGTFYNPFINSHPDEYCDYDKDLSQNQKSLLVKNKAHIGAH
jgi:hypothetical protein